MDNSNIVQGGLVVGRISAVHGVRGWVKVLSYTERPANVFDYQPWYIDKDGGTQAVELSAWKRHGDGFVAHLKGVDDRDIAREWCHRDIRVAPSVFPKLSDTEFYWHELEGLAVYNHFTQDVQRLGVVASLLETGANDVLVVEGDAESIDGRERLIPYSQASLLKVDLETKRIDVVWDPDF